MTRRIKDLTKSDLRALAYVLAPAMTDAEFELAWLAFLNLKYGPMERDQ